jgi:hypothetical protein
MRMSGTIYMTSLEGMIMFEGRKRLAFRMVSLEGCD